MIHQVRALRPDELDTALEVIEEGRCALALLHIDQWQFGVPGRPHIARDIAQNRLYGAFDAEGLCAVAALCAGDDPSYAHIEGKWLTSGPYLTVHRLAARARARHGGAAQALLARAEARARETGCVSVRVDTHRGNVVMQRFLAKNGYSNCGVVKLITEAQGDPLRFGYEKILE